MMVSTLAVSVSFSSNVFAFGGGHGWWDDGSFFKHNLGHQHIDQGQSSDQDSQNVSGTLSLADCNNAHLGLQFNKVTTL